MQLKTKLKGTNMIQIAYKFNVFEIKSHSYLNFINSWFYLYVGLLTLLYFSSVKIVPYKIDCLVIAVIYAYYQFSTWIAYWNQSTLQACRSSNCGLRVLSCLLLVRPARHQSLLLRGVC